MGLGILFNFTSNITPYHMTRKIVLGVFLLLMVAMLIVAYSFYKNVKPTDTDNTFLAIPQNAALILHEDNFHDLYKTITSTNIIWKELGTHLVTIHDFNYQLNTLDSLMQLRDLQEILLNNSITASLHMSGANNFNGIYYIPVSTGISQEKLLEKLQLITKTLPESRTYEGTNLYTIKLNNTKKVVFTYYKEMFVFSYSTILMEDVIRQLNAPTSLLDDQSFSKVLKTSGKAKGGNLYLNNQYFPKFLSQYLNNNGKRSMHKLNVFASWTALDLTVKPTSLMLNGFTHASTKKNNFLALFKNQKPQLTQLTEVVPSNTAFMFHYGLSNSKQFFTQKNQLLKSHNNYHEYDKLLNHYLNAYAIDLEAEFLDHIGSELAMVITAPIRKNHVEESSYIVFKATGIEKTTAALQAIEFKITEKNTKEGITHKGYPILRLPLDNALKLLLGDPFVNFETPYYTIMSEYVVVSNSEKSLKQWLDHVVAGKTLVKDEQFDSFSENLSSKSNILVYNNISRSLNLYATLVDIDLMEQMENNAELVRKFEALAFQISTEKDEFYYNNIFLKYNPIQKEHTHTLWETSLDTVFEFAPQLVINHYSNTHEVVVQDAKNQLYLVNNMGEILWKRQLNAPIMGSIQQVDAYKNGKLQLLFNTSAHIYLVDRNGKDVESFPVKLPKKATNGVTIMDYDKTKNYRLLVGCEDNMVYNYDISGNTVKGWEYTSTTSPATTKIWHLSFSGKDYVVIPLQNGQVKIVARSGKDRVILKNRLPKENLGIYLKRGSTLAKTHLITTSPSGEVSQLYLNDKLEQKQMVDQADSLKTFAFFDANNDRKKDYVYTNENKLKIIDQDKKVLIDQNFEDKIVVAPNLFRDKQGNPTVGFVLGEQIYLLDEHGLLKDGFPITGSTIFEIEDINKDNTLNLVVGNKDKLYNYNLK